MLGASHVYANMNYLYWQHRWLDTPVHFVGGLWLALAFVWLSSVFGRQIRTILPLIFIVLVVGVGWEVYEYIFEISYSSYYIFDTSKDLLMDVFGAIAAFLILKYTKLVPHE